MSAQLSLSSLSGKTYIYHNEREQAMSCFEPARLFLDTIQTKVPIKNCAIRDLFACGNSASTSRSCRLLGDPAFCVGSRKSPKRLLHATVFLFGAVLDEGLERDLGIVLT
ncbi:MAG: hypothetical protein O2960_30565, partial [Verrucomicrobia bacterium]|nr:hypothetical protein [Verrucomicrobiota bacterium]